MLIDDPIDLELDDDGQIVVPMRHTSGVAGVAQGIRIRVSMFCGEWFANLAEGMPYLPGDGISPEIVLLGGKFNRELADLLIRQRILAAPGVRRIAELAVSFEATTRTLSMNWKVQTIFGDTVTDSLQIP